MEDRTEVALGTGSWMLPHGSVHEAARGVSGEDEEGFCRKSFPHPSVGPLERQVSQQQTTEGCTDSSGPGSPLPDSVADLEPRVSRDAAAKKGLDSASSAPSLRVPVRPRDLAEMRAFLLSEDALSGGLGSATAKLDCWKSLSGKSEAETEGGCVVSGAFVSVEPAKTSSLKEPPRLGENGNWQCHACLNINYPRRSACNRCQTERSAENNRVVAEFISLKEDFLSMGLEPVAAAAAASAQQAARKALHSIVEKGGLLSADDHEDSAADSLSAELSLLQAAFERQQSEASSSLRSNPQSNASGKCEKLASSSAASFAFASRENSAGKAAFLRGKSFLHFSSGASASPSEASGEGGFRESAASQQFLQRLLLSPSRGERSAPQGAAVQGPTFFAAETPEVARLRAQLSASLGRHSLSTGEFDNGLLPVALLQLLLLKAHSTAETLVEKFVDLGEAHPAEKAADVLRTALAVLGFPPEDEHLAQQQSASSSFAGAAAKTAFSRRRERSFGAGAPLLLVHPEEFKNPSSFLKIYGDPLCEARSLGGASPPASVNGNWSCVTCGNVNFPRRFRCNKCADLRDAEGDRVVAEYAKAVYTQHAKTFKLQSAASLPTSNVSWAPPSSQQRSAAGESFSSQSFAFSRGASFASAPAGARLSSTPRSFAA